MTKQTLQHDLQPFGADHPDWADIERVLDRYEKFARERKIDKACRTGTTAFFLLFNGALFLTYALMAVRHTGENPLPPKLPFLSFLGIAACFVWWSLVSMSYPLWDGNKGPQTHARRYLQRQAIRMRWYWLLERIPLQDETPPKGVAIALPLAFIAIHILLGAILAAMVA